MDPRSQRDYIVALADDDPARRVEAARALYHWGCLAVEPALKTWRSDAELAALLGQALTVGIAVRPDTFERIHKAWGQPRLSSVPPEHEVAEFEIHAAEGVHLDILTPQPPESTAPLGRFLARHGEAIQQVEVPVLDVERAAALLKERFGLDPIYAAPRTGANGTRVNFVLVTVGEGRMLVELVQPPDPTNS
jgi:hypothetical protein